MFTKEICGKLVTIKYDFLSIQVVIGSVFFTETV